MASRKEQKEVARQQRLAAERARAERAQRDRRLRMLGGVMVVAVALVVAAVAISSGGSSPQVIAPTSPKAKSVAATVTKLLAGIPQSGTTLGSPNAKVTVTEYGDLACPICRDFALSSENQLISNDVRSGKVKIVYKPLETASGTANGSMFVPSQTAALAAGEQKLGWDFIELFYHEQGDETTNYMTNNYLAGLAQQVPGLNLSQWNSARQASSLVQQVDQGEQSATSQGFNSTPTLVVTGPKSQAQPIVGDPSSYGALESVINSVS